MALSHVLSMPGEAAELEPRDGRQEVTHNWRTVRSEEDGMGSSSTPESDFGGTVRSEVVVWVTVTPVHVNGHSPDAGVCLVCVVLSIHRAVSC